MKNIYIKSIMMSFIVVFVVSFYGCKKFVQIPPSPNLIVSSKVFSDSTDANSAVLGMYVKMIGYATFFQTYSGNITLYTGLSSDELYSTTGSALEQEAYQNALSSTSGVSAGFWADSYSIIYQANAIIEGLSATNSLTQTSKNKFLGEAKVIRAFCYFNLVNLFGDVPLVTSTNYQTNAQLPRATINAVYSQITSDLTSAESLLSVNYPSPGRVRVNKYAAIALLARAYLYQQQWSKADSAATQVINSGVYSLQPVLNNVFLAGSNEAIWQLQPTQAGFETAEGYNFLPYASGVIPSYVISPQLLGAFENGDQRKSSWLDTTDVYNGTTTTTYYYPFKYKLGYDGNTSPAEDYMVFRLAEQYLIRAEARIQEGGNLSGALADLNIVRKRAGLPNTSASGNSALLTAVYHERQVELFCEWGHRWYDLKRTNLANTVLGTGGVCAAKGGTWNTNWQLYPIDINQLQANPALKQNPGY